MNDVKLASAARDIRATDEHIWLADLFIVVACSEEMIIQT